MNHLQDLVLHQVWQVIPIGLSEWQSPGRLKVCRGCHIHIHGILLVAFLQLVSLSGVDQSFVILNTYI